MYLAKASEIVRREIFAEQNKCSGHFDRDSVVDSVPRCLVELVLMIEHRPDIKSQIENCLAKSDFAIAQLLYCHHDFVNDHGYITNGILQSASLIPYHRICNTTDTTIGTRFLDSPFL
jgi:hypothetical protein